MNNSIQQARLTCQAILTQVIQKKQSLAESFAQSSWPAAQQGWIKNICFGVCRWYLRLDGVLSQLLKKPLPGKHQDVYGLLIIAVYQLLYTRAKPAAVVNETVEVVKKIGKPWACGLTNGVLRQLIRHQSEIIDALPASLTMQTSHPAWLVEQVTTAWPQQAESILHANNQHPPLSLRINETQITRERYLGLFDAQQQTVSCAEQLPCGVRVEPAMPVEQLPGFAQGWVYVQDWAAQWAAYELDVQPGARVLDACAAPGGKTTHIAQLQPQLAQLIAVEQSAERIQHLEQNLARLQLSATVVCADVADSQTWWDGQLFDRILLDAPCSATGVIRRQPDVMFHRRAEDIDALVGVQARLLEACWSMLRQGGVLLYATCSILRAENVDQVRAFLKWHPDAVAQPLDD
ncbi:MAG: 16S rRNA (cytosine(967)-C(5))-methyltransferase RsmB, partial [Legionellales bacterium]|nr:16S rRNA (cytosine(967)-C(5))-methyltransferase RsmB [Legionellales bacterium]